MISEALINEKIENVETAFKVGLEKFNSTFETKIYDLEKIVDLTRAVYQEVAISPRLASQINVVSPFN